MASNLPTGYNVQAREPIDSRIVFAGRPWDNPFTIAVPGNSLAHIAYLGLISLDTTDDSMWILTDLSRSATEAGWTMIAQGASSDFEFVDITGVATSLGAGELGRDSNLNLYFNSTAAAIDVSTTALTTPITGIEINLADGGELTARINTAHTDTYLNTQIARSGSTGLYIPAINLPTNATSANTLSYTLTVPGAEGNSGTFTHTEGMAQLGTGTGSVFAGATAAAIVGTNPATLLSERGVVFTYGTLEETVAAESLLTAGNGTIEVTYQTQIPRLTFGQSFFVEDESGEIEVRFPEVPEGLTIQVITEVAAPLAPGSLAKDGDLNLYYNTTDAAIDVSTAALTTPIPGIAINLAAGFEAFINTPHSETIDGGDVSSAGAGQLFVPVTSLPADVTRANIASVSITPESSGLSSVFTPTTVGEIAGTGTGEFFIGVENYDVLAFNPLTSVVGRGILFNYNDTSEADNALGRLALAGSIVVTVVSQEEIASPLRFGNDFILGTGGVIEAAMDPSFELTEIGLAPVSLVQGGLGRDADLNLYYNSTDAPINVSTIMLRSPVEGVQINLAAGAGEPFEIFPITSAPTSLAFGNLGADSNLNFYRNIGTIGPPSSQFVSFGASVVTGSQVDTIGLGVGETARVSLGPDTAIPQTNADRLSLDVITQIPIAVGDVIFFGPDGVEATVIRIESSAAGTAGHLFVNGPTPDEIGGSGIPVYEVAGVLDTANINVSTAALVADVDGIEINLAMGANGIVPERTDIDIVHLNNGNILTREVYILSDTDNRPVTDITFIHIDPTDNTAYIRVAGADADELREYFTNSESASLTTQLRIRLPVTSPNVIGNGVFDLYLSSPDPIVAGTENDFLFDVRGMFNVANEETATAIPGISNLDNLYFISNTPVTNDQISGANNPTNRVFGTPNTATNNTIFTTAQNLVFNLAELLPRFGDFFTPIPPLPFSATLSPLTVGFDAAANIYRNGTEGFITLSTDALTTPVPGIIINRAGDIVPLGGRSYLINNQDDYDALEVTTNADTLTGLSTDIEIANALRLGSPFVDGSLITLETDVIVLPAGGVTEMPATPAVEPTYSDAPGSELRFTTDVNLGPREVTVQFSRGPGVSTLVDFNTVRLSTNNQLFQLNTDRRLTGVEVATALGVSNLYPNGGRDLNGLVTNDGNLLTVRGVTEDTTQDGFLVVGVGDDAGVGLGGWVEVVPLPAPLVSTELIINSDTLTLPTISYSPSLPERDLPSLPLYFQGRNNNHFERDFMLDASTASTKVWDTETPGTVDQRRVFRAESQGTISVLNVADPATVTYTTALSSSIAITGERPVDGLISLSSSQFGGDLIGRYDQDNGTVAAAINDIRNFINRNQNPDSAEVRPAQDVVLDIQDNLTGVSVLPTGETVLTVSAGTITTRGVIETIGGETVVLGLLRISGVPAGAINGNVNFNTGQRLVLRHEGGISEDLILSFDDLQLSAGNGIGFTTNSERTSLEISSENRVSVVNAENIQRFSQYLNGANALLNEVPNPRGIALASNPLITGQTDTFSFRGTYPTNDPNTILAIAAISRFLLPGSTENSTVITEQEIEVDIVNGSGGSLIGGEFTWPVGGTWETRRNDFSPRAGIFMTGLPQPNNIPPNVNYPEGSFLVFRILPAADTNQVLNLNNLEIATGPGITVEVNDDGTRIEFRLT